MRIPFRIFDPRVKRSPGSYLLQTMLATLALLAVLSVKDALSRTVVIAALGSTAFVLFVMPHSATASPRHVIGGHAIAVIVGSVAAVFDAEGAFFFALTGALTVGVSVLLMAITDTEHAPAAGTALGVVSHGFSWGLVLFLAVSVGTLVVLHQILRPRLRNLY